MNDNIIWLLIGVLFILIGYIGKIQGDIKRINKKLDLIARQIDISDNITEELKQLLFEGKKVKSVKKYRID